MLAPFHCLRFACDVEKLNLNRFEKEEVKRSPGLRRRLKLKCLVHRFAREKKKDEESDEGASEKNGIN